MGEAIKGMFSPLFGFTETASSDRIRIKKNNCHRQKGGLLLVVTELV
jgi:hypothetical protein